MTNPWDRVTNLVWEALALDPAERGVFLRANCVDVNGLSDPGLLKEVEALVAAAEEAEKSNALRSPISEIVEETEKRYLAVPPISLPFIKSWRAIRQLGIGGMGVVYEAERVEDHFAQRGALKILRPGLEPDFSLRFAREQALLSNLNHSGIVRLLDGGIHEDGTLFFVTELVSGDSILEYSQRKHLPLAERLLLFLQVCEAVAFAHQNLIVHRDIKPAHILVIDEPDPVVKLLDFGIAKLLESEEENLTRTGNGPLTPTYAAPEQFLSQPITTATDVYALGMVLYELVTEKRPYDLGTLTTAERERMVWNETPLLPSKHCGNSKKAQDLSGDLDHIIMKTLAKEPQRRYSSAEALGEDIKRFLAQQPVEASPDSKGYRLRKFIQRNQSAVISAVLVLSSLLLIAYLFTTRLATERNKANSAAIAAQEQAQRAQAIAGFLERILRAPNDKWYVDSEHKGPQTLVKDVLDEAAKRLESNFAQQPDLKADLHHILGDTYMALHADEEFEYHHRKALEIRRNLYTPPHPKLAEALYYVSIVEGSNGNLPARAHMLKEAAEMLQQRNEGNNYPFILHELANLTLDAELFLVADSLLSEAFQFIDNNFVLNQDGYKYRNSLLAENLQLTAQAAAGNSEIEKAINALSAADSFLLQAPPIHNYYANWRRHNCTRGKISRILGDLVASRQELLACYDHTHPEALQSPYPLPDSFELHTFINRVPRLKGRAAIELQQLYGDVTLNIPQSEIEAEAEIYESQVDSLKTLFIQNKVFEQRNKLFQ